MTYGQYFHVSPKLRYRRVNCPVCGRYIEWQVFRRPFIFACLFKPRWITVCTSGTDLGSIVEASNRVKAFLPPKQPKQHDHNHNHNTASE